MSGKYEDLGKLKELFDKGVITESEYNIEKAKILSGTEGAEGLKVENQVSAGGKNNNGFCSLMHLSRLSNYFVPGLGWIAFFVMWLTRRNESETVDLNGKIILNWTISAIIYRIVFVAGFLALFATSLFSIINNDDPLPFIGTIGVALIPLVIFGILDLVFTIIGAVKANNGEVWNYPLSIRFFSTK